MENNTLDFTTSSEFEAASKWQRFFNLLIDSLVFYVLWFFILVGLFVVKGDSDVEENELLYNLAGALLYGLFFFAIESATGGRSLGKYITGTKVITEDGERPSQKQFLIRAFSRIVPFESLSGFSYAPWHDQWSGTMVVKNK